MPFTTGYTQPPFTEDLRTTCMGELIDQKEKLIEETFLPLIGGTILMNRARLTCIVSHDKVETYYLDNIPVIEIHPMEFKHEYNEQGDPTLMAYYNYRILYKGDKNAV